ncbi:MAG: lipid A deacylase LpxR family protein, partial [Bacteroidota bacterium]|nr:lipid A deacylase LpxR family protein [Bacteroidota bacterium]
MDDDFFNLRGEGTDRGYSSGVKLEFYFTKKNKPKFPANFLMKIIDNPDNIYGLGLTQFIYTPTDISRSDIIYGDRPYSGVTYFSYNLISSSSIKKQRLSTTISLGTIGKYSYANEAQTWFHNIINYQKPEGWNNQIATDIIINYFVDYERQLFKPSPNLEIIGDIQANAGTLTNNMGLGIRFRAGLFNDYFSNYERPTFRDKRVGQTDMRKFQCFFFMKTTGMAVMDDATLQGGFFTHNASPYKISKDSINRFYMQYEYGITIAKKRLGISFSEKIRTPDFKGT